MNTLFVVPPTFIIPFLFINLVIFSDLLIISILNYLITGEITSNQYISFLFNSFAAFYLIGLILVRFTFLFLDHILRERLRLSLDKELKFSSINKLLKKRNKEVSDVAYEVNLFLQIPFNFYLFCFTLFI